MQQLLFPYDLYPTIQRRAPADGYNLRLESSDPSLHDGTEPQVFAVVDIKGRLSSQKAANHGVHHAVVTDGSNNGITLDMVCKVAYQRLHVTRLREEAAKYSQDLMRLQGRYVPTCYGFYVGQTGDGLTAILLLEYCGPLLQVPLWKQPVGFRCGTSCLSALFLS